MMASPFPAMKPKRFRRMLGRAFGYQRVQGRGKGSHALLRTSQDYPDLIDGFHDNTEVPAVLVGRILKDQVGLSQSEALKVVRDHG